MAFQSWRRIPTPIESRAVRNKGGLKTALYTFSALSAYEVG